jgi:putative membrane protein
MRYRIGLFPLVAGMALASGAVAQDTKSKSPAEAPGFDDTDFVMKSASGGLLKVALGKLAARRASDQKVKEFAIRMIEDHQRMNGKLALVAGELGVQITEKSITPDHQKHLDRLREMRGREFDRQYARHTARDHEAAVALFRRATTEARLKAVAAFAKEFLPTLEEHLKLARELQESDGEKADPKSPSKSDR